MSEGETPWERLSKALVARWLADELVLLAGDRPKLEESLADWLAGQAGQPMSGELLSEWLLDRAEIDDVYADDDILAASLEQEARRIALSDAEPDDRAARRARAERAMARERRTMQQAGIAALLERFGRRAFAPRVRRGDGPAAASKFGGVPYLLAKEAWPSCENCEQPMQLFVQLDLSDLPPGFAHPHREGMVQLFYCTSDEPLCEVDCEAWEPGAASTLARFIAPPLKPARKRKAPAQAPLGSPARLIGWQPCEPELPAYGEIDEVEEALVEHDLDPDTLRALDVRARSGDKLDGWPAWVQDPSYPVCPQCGRPMRYLLQLESNGLCGHQLGDLGAGHLFQCAEHADSVAFTWAGH